MEIVPSSEPSSAERSLGEEKLYIRGVETVEKDDSFDCWYAFVRALPATDGAESRLLAAEDVDSYLASRKLETLGVVGLALFAEGG